MSTFKFIHAADLHLDSPLVGLAKKSEDYAARIDDASRRAFDNLIALAKEEECRLLVIAGDVFDGQWRDYRTGLFFVDRMRQLRDYGIRVVMIAGNHDAENKFASRLEFSDNVKLLSARRPESVAIDEIETVVHGRSFPQRDVLENLASEYPPPVPSRFNIGLLHTACSGREGHASYAPCSGEQLANHGYQYWALGHVHTREVLNDSPPIVFPGNLQGRNARETGAKGATLVEVRDGVVAGFGHRALDVVRWSCHDLDLTRIEDRDALLSLARIAIEEAYAAADGRSLAIRLRLAGASGLHAQLIADATHLREEFETLAASVAADIWLEKVEMRTSPVVDTTDTDPTVAGKLRQVVDQLAVDPWFAERVEARLAEIRTKLPAGAQAEPFLKLLQDEGAERAHALALALLDKGRR